MGAELMVKGFAWLNLLNYAKERFGADTVLRLAKAFPEHEPFFDAAAVLPVGWVPGALHLGAVRWLVDECFGGKLDGAQQVGRDLANRNLTNTFSSFRRLEDLRTAIVSTERAFGQFYSQGTMRFTLVGDVLEARLTEFPNASLVAGHCLGAGLVAFLKAGHVEAELRSVKVEGDTIAYDVKLELPTA